MMQVVMAKTSDDAENIKIIKLMEEYYEENMMKVSYIANYASKPDNL